MSDLGAGSAVWHSRSLSGSRGWSTATTGLCTEQLFITPLWQQHACPHEDGWPVLSSGLHSPEKNLDNLISGCPWLLATAKACPVVNVLCILQPYLKVSVDLHLYVAWTTKVLVFQFQSCKC